MRGVLGIVRKDFEEMLLDPRALGALLILPSLILLLVGQLRVHPENFDLLIAGANMNECGKPAGTREVVADDETREAFLILEELSNIDVSFEPCPEPLPLSRIQTDGFDMVLDYDGENGTTIYIAETDPRRLQPLLDLARALRLTTIGTFGEDLRDDADALMQIYRIGALGGFPLQGVHAYYPQSLDRSLSLLPSTLALIVCFLPFVIAAPSLLREREARTLEVLLCAPRTAGATVFVGKCLLALAIPLASLLLMLVVMQSVYGLYVKIGLPSFLLFLLLPMLSAAFLGLAVSSLSSSQTHVVASAALYFLLLNLFGGFFFVPSEGSWLIQTLSALLPLTFTIAPANAWLFGAPVEAGLGGSVIALVSQALAYGALAVLSWRYRLRRI